MDSCTEGPRDGVAHLIFAHGAGAPMTSPFMEDFARQMTCRGVRVTRFNFPYMTAVQKDGKRRPPPPVAGLATYYDALVAEIAGKTGDKAPMFIGGKSMGGRIATLAVGALFDRGLCHGAICLGYPFHPKAKPERLRTEHLADFKVPTLIVQGERDGLGNREEVAGYNLSPAISCVWISDGDHDLKPRKKSGLTHEDNLIAASDAVAAWLSQQVKNLKR